MVLTNWWRKLFHRQSRQPIVKAGPARRRSRKLRLELESLENRLAPAIIMVTTLTDQLGVAGQVSLRDAIQTANATSGDEIQFAAGLFATPQIMHLTLGSLNLTSDVTITGPGAGTLTIQNASGRVFNVMGNATTTVTAVLTGLTIDGATTGGGIANQAGTKTTTLSVSGCVFSNNAATAGPGAGGAIDNTGVLTVDNTTFTANTAAAIGGAIANESGGTVQVTDSTFAGNSAGTGGGVADLAGAKLSSFTNDTFNNNMATGSGSAGTGGGLNVAGDVNLINDTFTLNNAANSVTGGGGVNVASGTVKVVNTILAGNTAGGGAAPDLAGTITDLGTNIKGGAALLAASGAYGGPTNTVALLPGSPAIDAGQSGTVGGLTIPTTDQRGKPRVSATDIGAFESQGFTLSADEGDEQRTLIGTNYDDPLVVEVVANNAVEPVAGGLITLTAPAVGASAAFTTANPATIAADGSAQVSVKANTTGGTFDVSATADGANTVAFTLTNQVVTALGFAQQPTDTASTAVINSNLIPAGVLVDILDQNGHRINNANNSVTIGLNTALQGAVDILNPANGKLPTFTGTFTVAATGGVAAFSDLTLDRWGAYTLKASSAGVPNSLSQSFNITASKLVFGAPAAGNVNPTQVRSGNNTLPAGDPSYFTQTVQAEDAKNDVAQNFTGTVSLTINSATQLVLNDILGQAQLEGPNGPTNNQSIAAVAGVATFAGLTLDKWGDYTLHATTPNTSGGPVSDIVSPKITVNANHLAFGPSAAGNVNPTQVRSGNNTLAAGDPSYFTETVQAEDITNSVAQNFTGTVSLTINTATQLVLNDILGQAQLEGPNGPTNNQSIAAVAGVATFPGLTLDKWGDYTLRAKTPNTPGGPVNDGVSPKITVNANHLVFGLPAPGNVNPTQVRSGNNTLPAGDPSYFTETVQAEDIANSVALNFTGTVSLTINSATQLVLNDILGQAQLEGPNGPNNNQSIAAVAGVATFSNLTLDKWGNYTLHATTPNSPGGPVTDTVSGQITVNANHLAFGPPAAGNVNPTQVRSGNNTLPAGDPSYFTETVQAEDITNSVALNFTGTVTLTINSATQLVLNDILGQAQLEGPNGPNNNQSIATVAGVATFPGLTLDKWGDYTLRAKTPNTPGGPVNDGVSPKITVNANHLVFGPPVAPNVNPTQVRSGNNTLPSNDPSRFIEEVQAEDITNDVAKNFTNNITLAINSASQFIPAGTTEDILTFPTDANGNILAGSVTLAFQGVSAPGPLPLKPGTQPSDVQTYLSSIPGLTNPGDVAVSDTPGGTLVVSFKTGLDATKLQVVTPGSGVTITPATADITARAKLGGNHPDPVNSNTQTVQAQLGVATFDGATLDKWGDYTLLSTTPNTPAGPVIPTPASPTIHVNAYQLLIVTLQDQGLARSAAQAQITVKGKPIPFTQFLKPALTVTSTMFPARIWAVDITVDANQLLRSGAGVTTGSTLVTLADTTLLAVGQKVTISDGTTTLTSAIAKVTPNVSVTLTDKWTGATGVTATLTAGGDLRTQVQNIINAALTAGLPAAQQQTELDQVKFANAALNFTSNVNLAVTDAAGNNAAAPIPNQAAVLGQVIFNVTLIAPTFNITASRVDTTLSPPAPVPGTLPNGTSSPWTGRRRDVVADPPAAGSGAPGGSAAPLALTAPSYKLTSDGKLLRTDDSGTVVLDTGVASLTAAGTGIYYLEDTGKLFFYDGWTWTLLDVGVASFGVDGTGNNVFILEGDGNVRLHQMAGNTFSFAPLVTSVTHLVVTNGGVAYFLDSTGNLRQDNAGTISLVDSGVTSFQLDGSGNLYELLASGNLYKTSSQTPPLAIGVASFAVTSAGVVDALGTNGVLTQAGVQVAANVAAFQVADDGSLYYLDSAGNLNKQGASVPLDTGIKSFTLAGDGNLYDLTNAGDLKQQQGAGMVWLDGKVKSFVVTSTGTIYILENSGALWTLQKGQWAAVEYSTKSILLLQGDGVVDLDQGGGLFLLTSRGGSQWDSGVTSISPAAAPFQVQAVESGGATRTLGAVQSSTPTGTGGLYSLLANGELWLYAGGAWSRFARYVKAFALDSQGNVYLLDPQGVLWYYKAGVWSLIDGVGDVQALAVAADDTLVYLKANGHLWAYTGTWQSLDTQVTSFTVTGNTVMSTSKSGTKTNVV
jgi:hypothetical protein